jgi:hypothetical protein
MCPTLQVNMGRPRRTVVPKPAASSACRTQPKQLPLSYKKPTRKKNTRIDAWQNGNKYARQEKEKWLKLATVDFIGNVMPPLTKYGFCILNNFTNCLDADCKPTEDQRDYILKVPSADTDGLFEGAQLSDTIAYTSLVRPTETRVSIRVQL